MRLDFVAARLRSFGYLSACPPALVNTDLGVRGRTTKPCTTTADHTATEGFPSCPVCGLAADCPHARPLSRTPIWGQGADKKAIHNDRKSPRYGVILQLPNYSSDGGLRLSPDGPDNIATRQTTSAALKSKQRPTTDKRGADRRNARSD